MKATFNSLRERSWGATAVIAAVVAMLVLTSTGCSTGAVSLNYFVQQNVTEIPVEVEPDGTPTAYWVDPGVSFAVARYQSDSELCHFKPSEAILQESNIVDVAMSKVSAETVCVSKKAVRVDVFELPSNWSASGLSVHVHYPDRDTAFEFQLDEPV